MLRDFGADHGLAREAAAIENDLSPRERTRILDMRKNPYLAAVMASEMLKKDAADIGEKLGRDLTTEEIYLAHFLGPGDAYKFLAKVDLQPKAVAAKLLPKPARANRPIFFARSGRKSKSLSVAEVHRKLEQSMGLRLDRYRNVTDSRPDRDGLSLIQLRRIVERDDADLAVLVRNRRVGRGLDQVHLRDLGLRNALPERGAAAGAGAACFAAAFLCERLRARSMSVTRLDGIDIERATPAPV